MKKITKFLILFSALSFVMLWNTGCPQPQPETQPEQEQPKPDDNPEQENPEDEDPVKKAAKNDAQGLELKTKQEIEQYFTEENAEKYEVYAYLASKIDSERAVELDSEKWIKVTKEEAENYTIFVVVNLGEDPNENPGENPEPEEPVEETDPDIAIIKAAVTDDFTILKAEDFEKYNEEWKAKYGKSLEDTFDSCLYIYPYIESYKSTFGWEYDLEFTQLCSYKSKFEEKKKEIKYYVFNEKRFRTVIDVKKDEWPLAFYKDKECYLKFKLDVTTDDNRNCPSPVFEITNSHPELVSVTPSTSRGDYCIKALSSVEEDTDVFLTFKQAGDSDYEYSVTLNFLKDQILEDFTVSPKEEGVDLMKESYVGKEIQLAVSNRTPSNSVTKTFKYKSTNEKYLTVDENGLVKLLAPGYAEVIVTADDAVQCEKRVEFPVRNEGEYCPINTLDDSFEVDVIYLVSRFAPAINEYSVDNCNIKTESGKRDSAKELEYLWHTYGIKIEVVGEGNNVYSGPNCLKFSHNAKSAYTLLRIVTPSPMKLEIIASATDNSSDTKNFVNMGYAITNDTITYLENSTKSIIHNVDPDDDGLFIRGNGVDFGTIILHQPGWNPEE